MTFFLLLISSLLENTLNEPSADEGRDQGGLCVLSALRDNSSVDRWKTVPLF
jgi:hypothetical protein